MNAEWRPSCSLSAARSRAAAVQELRHFFAERGLLEIDAPVIQAGPNADHGIQPLTVPGAGFLITSPEHALKRCLCAGFGDCWSLSPCFRAGERGQRHNPEFRMIEWYRLGWDDRRLSDECVALCRLISGRALPQRQRSWRAAYQDLAGIDPLQASEAELITCCGASATAAQGDRAALLDLILIEQIEPQLGSDCFEVVVDYPPTQAAQARLRRDPSGELVAARFEVYHAGLELANGYHECGEAREIGRRLNHESAALGLSAPDARYLAALAAGLPDCAGVAVGLERLLMLRLGSDDITKTLPFAWERR